MIETDANAAGLKPVEKKSRTGLIVFLAVTALIVLAIGYRAFNPVIAPEIAEANANGPLTIPELQARAEQDPLDSKAWQELAFAHFSGGGYGRAARAYSQATKGDPDNAVLWSALGESRVMASERDPMPPGAVTAFEKAIELDPTDPRARYFLGVRKDLAGDARGAIADWVALLKDTPPGAVWEQNTRRTIEQVGKVNQIDTAPMLAEIDAVRALPADEQQDMIEGMVDRLDIRLRGQPDDVNGWVMLMRSRMTLGQPDKAARALEDAIAANPAQASRLRSEAATLQVP